MCGNLQQGLRVLIIVEGDQMRRLVREMLTLLGLHDIEAVSNAADGLDRLRAYPRYDLVLSDHELGVVTGIDLLTLIRNDTSLESISFVLMTNGLSQSEVDELDDAGEVYLLKPFNTLSLKTAIVAALLCGVDCMKTH